MLVVIVDILPILVFHVFKETVPMLAQPPSVQRVVPATAVLQNIISTMNVVDPAMDAMHVLAADVHLVNT